MTTLYVQCPTLYLAGSGTIVGATSVVLTSLTDIYGNILTMADFGSIGYFTCEPDTTNAEAGTFTGITANPNGTYTLTGVKTLLAKSPYTQTSGLVRSHSGGTKIVITDNVGFWDTFVNKNGTATITSVHTYATGATPVIIDAPVNSTDAANKGYIDSLVIAGGVDASTTIKGISKLSSASATSMGNLGVLTSLGTATMTIATPAVVTLASHGLVLNDIVQFTTTGALPTGLTASTNYYVIAAGLTANTFELSATQGGAAINTSGTQSGVHTLFKLATISIASPAVAYLTSHGFTAGDTIKFSTTGALPTGITAGNTYYVLATGLSTNSFQFSATLGGTAVNTSGTQSGTHSITRTTPYAVGNDDPRLPTQAENDALAGTSGTPSGTNKYVTDADTSGTGAVVRASALPNLFGDGSDGTVTFDGTTTILGMVPSANVYTLTRDFQFSTVTVNTGITINTGGYRFFAKTLLTLTGTAVIQNNGVNGGNGGNATSGSGGTAGTAGTASAAVTVFSSGGAGTVGTAGTSQGPAASNASNTTAVTNSVGLAGGNGGSTNAVGSVATGGTAGTATSSSTNGIRSYGDAIQQAILGTLFKAGTSGAGGAGGSSAGNSSGSSYGGGGGGGGSAGGVVWIAAKAIAGTGTIKSVGGNGGNGGNANAGNGTGAYGAAGGGGGGAGAGGIIVLISSTAANSFTMTVTGGTGGTAGTGVSGGGAQSATAGTNGGSGNSYFITV